MTVMSTLLVRRLETARTLHPSCHYARSFFPDDRDNPVPALEDRPRWAKSRILPPMASTDAHIDPTEQQITALVDAAKANEAPVVMINLLAFNDEGGQSSYELYAAEVLPHLERVGARITYAGKSSEVVIGGTEHPWWDAIAVVEYPSRAKFIEMVSDPDYQKIARHRSAALSTSELIATEPWS
jgi:uncharacterized protein (DUF1330 family)